MSRIWIEVARPLCETTNKFDRLKSGSGQEFEENFLDSKHVLKVYFKPSRKKIFCIFTTSYFACPAENSPLKTYLKTSLNKIALYYVQFRPSTIDKGILEYQLEEISSNTFKACWIEKTRQDQI